MTDTEGPSSSLGILLTAVAPLLLPAPPPPDTKPEGFGEHAADPLLLPGVRRRTERLCLPPPWHDARCGALWGYGRRGGPPPPPWGTSQDKAAAPTSSRVSPFCFAGSAFRNSPSKPPGNVGGRTPRRRRPQASAGAHRPRALTFPPDGAAVPDPITQPGHVQVLSSVSRSASAFSAAQAPAASTATAEAVGSTLR